MKLKNNIIIWLLGLFLVVNFAQAQAQDNQGLGEIVDEILAQMPAYEQEQINTLMLNVIELGELGLQEVLGMIIGPGAGDDTKARFAVESLSRFLSQPGMGYQGALWETLLLAEIEQRDDRDEKAFLMSQLNYIGGDATIEKLSKYLRDDSLYDPAIRAMRDANPKEAAKVFSDYLGKAEGYSLIAMVNAIGELGFKEYAPSIAALAETSDYELQRSVLICLAKLGVTDDQKLLIIRKMATYTSDIKTIKQLIYAAGEVKTFLSFVFVSQYLDESILKTDAALSLVEIALPEEGENSGLNGPFVRDKLITAREVLAVPDTEELIVALENYLKEMSTEEGYLSMFNGTDLSGWQGLAADPVKKKRLSANKLKKLQSAADQQMVKNWSVKDNSIVFNGKGANLCSVKEYESFELIVDWRITKKGDSGIYLRGSPQVQIWDNSRIEVGAEVGSGGLYNNSKHPKDPLLVADNPVGDWNTFRITMIGERVTIYLNGQLVVDKVVMENYWDRSIPIFPSGSIELQAHGSDLAFRDIYIMELEPVH